LSGETRFLVPTSLGGEKPRKKREKKLKITPKRPPEPTVVAGPQEGGGKGPRGASCKLLDENVGGGGGGMERTKGGNPQVKKKFRV